MNDYNQLKSVQPPSPMCKGVAHHFVSMMMTCSTCCRSTSPGSRAWGLGNNTTDLGLASKESTLSALQHRHAGESLVILMGMQHQLHSMVWQQQSTHMAVTCINRNVAWSVSCTHGKA